MTEGDPRHSLTRMPPAQFELGSSPAFGNRTEVGTDVSHVPGTAATTAARGLVVTSRNAHISLDDESCEAAKPSITAWHHPGGIPTALVSAGADLPARVRIPEAGVCILRREGLYRVIS